MMRLLCMGMIALNLGAFCQVRLQILPIDFKDTEDFFFPKHLRQIESVGERIYPRSLSDPYITVIDKSGTILDQIGRRGRGPGEVTHGVLAMGLYEEQLWIQDASQRNTLPHFVDGVYSDKVFLEGNNISRFSQNSNVFAVAEKTVIFPTSPRTGHLAQIISSHSGKRFIGELRFDKRDQELLRRVPGMNDTNWIFHDNCYYCLFIFFPLILKFDKEFKRVNAFSLDNPMIQGLYVERVADFQPSDQIQNASLFFDFKAHGGELFIMTVSALLRIDANTGFFKKYFRFYGKYGDFLINGNKGHNLNISQFTILNDGTVILSGSYKWGHDPWYVSLPRLRDGP